MWGGSGVGLGGSLLSLKVPPPPSSCPCLPPPPSLCPCLPPALASPLPQTPHPAMFRGVPDWMGVLPSLRTQETACTFSTKGLVTPSNHSKLHYTVAHTHTLRARLHKKKRSQSCFFFFLIALVFSFLTSATAPLRAMGRLSAKMVLGLVVSVGFFWACWGPRCVGPSRWIYI